MKPVLRLDPAVVRRARALAKKAGKPVVALARTHTTVSVERAVLRLGGIGGADVDGIPWVNRLVDEVQAQVGLEHGVALPVYDALLHGAHDGPHHPGAEGGRRLDCLPRPGRQGRRPAPSGPRPRRSAPGITRIDRNRASPRSADPPARRPAAEAVDLPDRRDRRHLRGHPAGAGRRPRGRRHRRGDPLDRSVAARLRARGRDPRGLRRHVRDPGELPADAGGAGRREPRAQALRPAHELRLRPVHAGDRDAGRARAARHDAQRLDVRDPVPRHQPDPDLRRPAVLPAGARPRRDHHQHR